LDPKRQKSEFFRVFLGFFVFFQSNPCLGTPFRAEKGQKNDKNSEKPKENPRSPGPLLWPNIKARFLNFKCRFWHTFGEKG
jgi:hypothetical protein